MSVSELQEEIVITDDAISGKLKNVLSYPGFGDKDSAQPGHYLALSFESDNSDKITTRVVGGSRKVTDCTADKFCVYRIKNNTQKIEVKATKGDETITKTYALTDLQLLED